MKLIDKEVNTIDYFIDIEYYFNQKKQIKEIER